MFEFSDIEEMYLKTIFEVHSDTPDAIVKTTQLAELMGVSAASVTEMVQRLAQREMVTHIPYRGCRLTTEGFQLAARIKRREGLLEVLLTDVIGFQGNVKEVACKMEHAVDSDLETTLDRLLGYPEKTTDGTRIPSVERNFESIGVGALLPLSRLPEGSSAAIELIVANDVESITIRDTGLGIGAVVTMVDGTISCDDRNFEFSNGLSMKILARVRTMGAE
ncbi:MAG TPA: metal-dependent transcriptional regulator [Candidatus Thalassarchaeaceae archaeon]|jgi:DtxR family Mn-dependent transcriptional regulator|nr:metal-dependent transcriptional regulator [Candidatus Thalassarchaeaceae archaeon]